jgi:prepilin-type N-terminal cleavage/methylation domain-containing protein
VKSAVRLRVGVGREFDARFHGIDRPPIVGRRLTETNAMPTRRAFTLVELLVVVAIIVALLAILLPSMAHVVSLAQRAACASNLHQLHAATIAYTSDSTGVVPSIGSEPRIDFWHSHFADTLRSRYLGGERGVMACPSMPELTEQQFLTATASTARLAWYVATMTPRLNPALPPASATADLNADGAMDNLSIARMADPGDRVMYADTNWLNTAGQWQVTNSAFLTPGVPHPGRLATAQGVPPAGANRVTLAGAATWTDFGRMQPVYSYSGTIFDANRDVWW